MPGTVSICGRPAHFTFIRPYGIPRDVAWREKSFGLSWLCWYTDDTVAGEFNVFFSRTLAPVWLGLGYTAFLLVAWTPLVSPREREYFIAAGITVPLIGLFDLVLHVFVALSPAVARLRMILSFVMPLIVVAASTWFLLALAEHCSEAVDLSNFPGRIVRNDAERNAACVAMVEPYPLSNCIVAGLGATMLPAANIVIAVTNMLLTFAAGRAYASNVSEPTGELVTKLLITGVASCASIVICFFRFFSAKAAFEATVHIEMQRQETAARARELEQLLKTIVPAAVLPRLIDGGDAQLAIDSAPSASMLFADMKGFTAWSSTRNALQVTSMLNTVVAALDKIAWNANGVEKIKTIGDAYWAVSGIPVPTEDHADQLVHFGWHMNQVIAVLSKGHAEWGGVSWRVGVHSGPMMGALFGDRQVSYEVFGETSRICQIVEANGIPGQLCVTPATLASLLLPPDAAHVSDVALVPDAKSPDGSALVKIMRLDPPSDFEVVVVPEAAMSIGSVPSHKPSLHSVSDILIQTATELSTVNSPATTPHASRRSSISLPRSGQSQQTDGASAAAPEATGTLWHRLRGAARVGRARRNNSIPLSTTSFGPRRSSVSSAQLTSARRYLQSMSDVGDARSGTSSLVTPAGSPKANHTPRLTPRHTPRRTPSQTPGPDPGHDSLRDSPIDSPLGNAAGVKTAPRNLPLSAPDRTPIVTCVGAQPLSIRCSVESITALDPTPEEPGPIVIDRDSMKEYVATARSRDTVATSSAIDEALFEDLGRPRFPGLPWFGDRAREARFKAQVALSTRPMCRGTTAICVALHAVVMVSGFTQEEQCLSTLGFSLQACAMPLYIAALVVAAVPRLPLALVVPILAAAALLGNVGTNVTGFHGCTTGLDTVYYSFVVSECVMLSVGAVSWPLVFIATYVCGVIPTVVLGIFISPLPVNALIMPHYGLFFSGVAAYAEERSVRRKFLEEELAVAGERRIATLQSERVAVLERLVPSHVVADLIAWFGTGMDPLRSIARTYDRVVVAFVQLRPDAIEELPRLHVAVDEDLRARACDPALTEQSCEGVLDKIKTVGDLVMVAGPFPSRHGDGAAVVSTDDDIARTCEALLRFVAAVRGRCPVRVGAHIGPVVGTVQGLSRLAFDTFGDVVNVASRVMSNAQGSTVMQVTRTLRDVMGAGGGEGMGFLTAARFADVHRIEAKGKGTLEVAALIEESLPNIPTRA